MTRLKKLRKWCYRRVRGDSDISGVSNESQIPNNGQAIRAIASSMEGQAADRNDAIKFGTSFGFRSSASLDTLVKAKEEVTLLFKAAARHSEKVSRILTKVADDTYYMGHTKRGVCVIVNQKTFSAHTGLNERRGTDVDADHLFQTFEGLSFEVHRHDNLKEKELHKVLKYWQDYDHSDCDAFVFCLLSHGERDLVYHTEGKMPTDHLFAPFAGDQCATLVGKPKLFFIQACRGDWLDKGALATDQTDSTGGDVYRLPAHADFLICYSTVAGYYSWRNTCHGSWFVQALCDVLKRKDLLREHDILSLMTLVNKNVALNFESSVPGNTDMDQRKQASEGLRKNVLKQLNIQQKATREELC
ncbi:caspase-1-like isoform X5 [Varroa destructor]|uniref:Caspase-3 n=1 Tax=Varroa destructor TaxID=109461 RepID=A0A7M7KYY6_VARDE|nr:caspase-1-like isoform X5 [Varroa destructor]